MVRYSRSCVTNLRNFLLRILPGSNWQTVCHILTRWSAKPFAFIHQDPPPYARYDSDIHCNFQLRLKPRRYQAYVDDVIPLSKPVHTADGQVVDQIFVAKGTHVFVPIMAINRSEALWGKNAKNFDPGRWLDDSISQQQATEIHGYRHLLTFADGPRTCLGRTFALTELKVMPRGLIFLLSIQTTLLCTNSGRAVCPDTELHVWIAGRSFDENRESQKYLGTSEGGRSGWATSTTDCQACRVNEVHHLLYADPYNLLRWSTVITIPAGRFMICLKYWRFN